MNRHFKSEKSRFFRNLEYLVRLEKFISDQPKKMKQRDIVNLVDLLQKAMKMSPSNAADACVALRTITGNERYHLILAFDEAYVQRDHAKSELVDLKIKLKSLRETPLYGKNLEDVDNLRAEILSIEAAISDSEAKFRKIAKQNSVPPDLWAEPATALFEEKGFVVRPEDPLRYSEVTDRGVSLMAAAHEQRGAILARLKYGLQIDSAFILEGWTRLRTLYAGE